MTNKQLQSRKYIIDYLTDNERSDTIIKSAISMLKNQPNSSYHSCASAKDIGLVFDEIGNNRNDVIIHFLAHGSELGILKKTDQYFLEVIHWELLLKSLEKVRENCNSLSLNLMAVCSSYNMVRFNNKPYDLIWTVEGITNSIEKSLLIYVENSFLNVIANFEESKLFHENKGG